MNIKRLAVLCGVGLLAGDISLCAAQSSGEQADVSVRMSAAAGIRRFAPGRWGLLRVWVVNRSDDPAEVTSVAFFSAAPGVQFARRLWTPAKSTRQATCPVLAPDNFGEKESAKIEWAQLDSAGSRETLTPRFGERMFGDFLAAVNTASPVLGIMNNRDDSDAQAVDDMVLALRVLLRRREPPARILGDFSPEAPQGYDGLDQLVLADDRLAFDSAGMAALRHWVCGGGRLWVMLDRVDPAMVELLLGDAFRCQVVDRVGLTEVLVQDAGSEFGSEVDAPREFEQPVELVRVLLEEAAVTHTVNGWPAAFRRPLGRGEVFFTTLGPRGWIRHRNQEDPKPLPRLDYVQYVPTAPLGDLAGDYMRPRDEPPVSSEQLEPFLAQRIGYRIVSRSTVISLLGGFCLALAVIGGWLAGRGRLEWLGWIGPGLAIVVGAALVLLGMRTRDAVPPTVAEMQIVDVTPDGYDVELTGLTAIYRPNPSAKPIHAGRGGVLMPDMAALEGTTRRMVWTDLDAWTWRNLNLPGGIRTAAVRYAGALEEPVEAHATFGPRGLTGAFASGPFEEPADAIVVTPWAGNLAASLGADGSFACDSGDLLAPGQFLTDALLDDRQRERQSVYALLDGLGEPAGQPAAALLFWANPLDTRFTFAEDARRTGSALVRVPLRIERPPPGSEVVVPSPFLPYNSVPAPSGAVSVVYSRSENDWLPCRSSSETWLRFQVPAVLLPLQTSRATLTIRIKAPSRSLEILGLAGDRVITLDTRQSPAEVLTFVLDRSTVEDARILALDARGGMTLGFRVGSDQPDAPGERDPLITNVGRSWKIDSLRLDLEGQAVGMEQP